MKLHRIFLSTCIALCAPARILASFALIPSTSVDWLSARPVPLLAVGADGGWGPVLPGKCPVNESCPWLQEGPFLA